MGLLYKYVLAQSRVQNREFFPGNPQEENTRNAQSISTVQRILFRLSRKRKHTIAIMIYTQSHTPETCSYTHSTDTSKCRVHQTLQTP